MRGLVWFLAIGAALSFCTIDVASAQTRVEINPGYNAQLPPDPLGAMQHARERVAAGDLNGAINGLKAYLFGHPDETGPERLLGDLYFRRGELKKAEETYLHVLTYAPADKDTHNRLGSVYATENRIDDAISEFNRSLPGTDSVPDLVLLHLRKGDFEKYKDERIAVARQYPTDSEAQLELGQVYEAIHQPQLAVMYFRRALDNDPDSLMAFNGLGLAYMDERDYVPAIAEFKTCLQRDTANYACEDNLGAAYLEDAQYAIAETVLNNARRLAPEQSEALVNLGYLSDVRGDWKHAISLYVEAMTVYPYSPDSYIDLGYTYNVHGLYQLAQQALIKGLAIAPYDGRLHFLLGDAYEHQGNRSMAEEQYKAAASIQDLDPEVKRLAQQRVATIERMPRQ